MYMCGVGKDRIVLLACVDDLLSICSHKMMEKWKQEMDKARGGHWDLQDYSELKVFLGCDIHRDLEAGTIHYSQHTHITNIAERFNLTNTTPVLTPFEPGTVLTARDPNDENARDENLGCIRGAL